MKTLYFFSALLTAHLIGSNLSATPSICDSVAGNVVTNCGFETGTFSGWTVTPAGYNGQYYGVDNSDAFSGNYGAYLAGQNPGTEVFLSQAVPTVAGMTYYVTFELAHPDANIPPYSNLFMASFGSATLLSETNQQFGFTEFTYSELATSSSTVLSFAALDPLNFFSLDDVSVYPTPEPSTTVFCFPLLLAGIIVLLRRRRVRTSFVP